jgi:hypothetical protein
MLPTKVVLEIAVGWLVGWLGQDQLIERCIRNYIEEIGRNNNREKEKVNKGMDDGV